MERKFKECPAAYLGPRFPSSIHAAWLAGLSQCLLLPSIHRSSAWLRRSFVRTLRRTRFAIRLRVVTCSLASDARLQAKTFSFPGRAILLMQLPSCSILGPVFRLSVIFSAVAAMSGLVVHPGSIRIRYHSGLSGKWHERFFARMGARPQRRMQGFNAHLFWLFHRQ